MESLYADESTLDELLDNMGLSDTIKDAIKAALATGANVFTALALFAIDASDVLIQVVLFVLDHIFLVKDMVGVITLEYSLSLQVDVAYNASYPEGWKVQVQGSTSKFPELVVDYDINAHSGAIYQKNDLYPQGMLGLALAEDSIPVITKFI